MRDLLKFVSEPRVSILGGLGFILFYELLQDKLWIEALFVAAITILMVVYGRKA